MKTGPIDQGQQHNCQHCLASTLYIMNTHQAKTQRVNDGCELSYCHYPNKNKPTVLLSHSLGVTQDMWQPQLNELQQHFNVLTYDMRGHGGSEVFPGYYSMDRLGNDVVQLLDALEIERVHFCGLSIGGMIGQWLAFHHPGRLSSLVLANTSACISPPSLWQQRIEMVLKAGMSAIWKPVLTRWFTPSFIDADPVSIDKTKSMFLSVDAKGYAGCCAAIRDMDLRRFATANQLPTLVIAGTQDVATPPEQSHYLVEQYSKGGLVELNAAHLSNIEQADKFTASLIAFLTEQKIAGKKI